MTVVLVMFVGCVLGVVCTDESQATFHARLVHWKTDTVSVLCSASLYFYDIYSISLSLDCIGVITSSLSCYVFPVLFYSRFFHSWFSKVVAISDASRPNSPETSATRQEPPGEHCFMPCFDCYSSLCFKFLNVNCLDFRFKPLIFKFIRVRISCLCMNRICC